VKAYKGMNAMIKGIAQAEIRLMNESTKVHPFILGFEEIPFSGGVRSL